MAFDTEMTLDGFFRSPSLVHDQPSNVITIQWNHRRRVFGRTRTGILTLMEDEPLRPSEFSVFNFRFGIFSEVHGQIWDFLAGRNFPPLVCDFLCLNITSFAVNFAAGGPPPPYPPILIIADINFIEPHYVDYIRQPLEFNQPRQLGAAAFIDETFILTEGWADSEVDYIRRIPDLNQPHSPFLDETFILGTSRQGWRGRLPDLNQPHSPFLDETFIQGTSREGWRGGLPAFNQQRQMEAAAFMDETYILGISTAAREDDEVDNHDVSDSTIEMLRRRRQSWATKGGEEENCSVCLERFSDAAEVISLPCDHVYHDGYILNWVKKKQTCPLCRRQI